MTRDNRHVRWQVGLIVVTTLLLVGCGGKKDEKKKSKPEGYLETVLESKKIGEAAQIEGNLRAVGQTLKMAQVSGEPMPKTLDELIRQVNMGRKPFTGTKGEPMVYVPPKRGASQDTVILYDPSPLRDGRHIALTLAGTPVRVQAEELPK